MDKKTEAILKTIYKRFENESEFSVDSSNYQQIQIDVLVNEGLIEKIDASTQSGWQYILKPTYAGKTYFQKKAKERRARCKHIAFEWIKFLIPTFISIAALIVSIIALNKE